MVLYFLNAVIGLIVCAFQLELKQKDGSDPDKGDIQLPTKEFRQIAMAFKAGESCSEKVVENKFPLTILGFVRFSFNPHEFNCDEIILQVCNFKVSSNVV